MLTNEQEQLLETITEIDTGVFLANANVAKNLNFYKEKEIKAVLNCSHDLPFHMDGIHQMRISLVDTPESNNEMLLQLKPAVEFIKNNKPILIHCFAGISRSPTVSAAYLMETKRMSPQDAVNFIVSKRSFAFMGGTMVYYADALNRYYEILNY